MPSINYTKNNESIDDSIIHVQIKDNFGWMVETVIERDKTQKSISYNTFINFFHDDINIDVFDIFDVTNISQLVDNYKIATSNLYGKYGQKDDKENICLTININKNGQVENIIRQQPLSSENKNSIIQSIIKMVKELENSFDLIHDLSSIDVYTKEQSSDKILARTKIELDADIITLFSNQIFEQNIRVISILLKLHNHNVYLVNQIVQNKIKNFCNKLYTLDKVIKGVSLTPLMVSLINLLVPYIHNILQISQHSFSISYVAVSTIVSGIAYQYGPKIVFRYAPTIFFKIIPKILSYFVNHKILSKINVLSH